MNILFIPPWNLYSLWYAAVCMWYHSQEILLSGLFQHSRFSILLYNAIFYQLFLHTIQAQWNNFNRMSGCVLVPVSTMHGYAVSFTWKIEVHTSLNMHAWMWLCQICNSFLKKPSILIQKWKWTTIRWQFCSGKYRSLYTRMLFELTYVK